MSRRLKQKILGPPKIPTPEGSSDEEYEPHCSYTSKNKNTYAGLEIQTSDSELEDSSDDSNASCDMMEMNKANKPRKVKGTHSKQSKSVKVDSPNIEQIVREVNDLLGQPSPEQPPAPKKEEDSFESVFSVRKAFLNPQQEFEKLFGRFETEVKKKKNKPLKPKKDMVRNPITPITTQFKCKGLSMSIVERSEDGVTHFVYNHSRQYQEWHRTLLAYLKKKRGRHFNDQGDTPVMEAFDNLHVEGMLEFVRYFCVHQEYARASDVVEAIIAYMQLQADPLFNITNGKTRLEYKYMENRAFFIAVLQYSYLASTRGCHRSALELIKMLLTLDPTDPLALVFALDVFAMRAREFEWFLRAADVLDRQRDAKMLFNVQFSCALAHFHLATGRKEDTTKATELLKGAMLSFPYTVMTLLTSMGLTATDSRLKAIRNLRLFNQYAQTTTSDALQDAIVFYAMLAARLWKEQPVLEWLVQTARQLGEQYDGSPETSLIHYESVRRSVYRNWPCELGRHSVILSPFLSFVTDQTEPAVYSYYATMCSFDPMPSPSKTINRYGYEMICCCRGVSGC